MTLGTRAAPTARIAFAGLSPLCEEILRCALQERPDIEFVAPWTLLPALAKEATPGLPEFLFIELHGTTLPSTLRVLIVAAEPLRIVGLSPDARSATLFTINEQRTVLFDYSVCELWNSVTKSGSSA